MALQDSLLNVGASAMAADVTHIGLASANPDPSGTNATSHGRVAAGWGAPTGGDVSIGAPLTFTGGAANGAVTHATLWTAASGGTYRGSIPLTGDTSSNAAGEYVLNSLTMIGTPV